MDDDQIAGAPEIAQKADNNAELAVEQQRLIEAEASKKGWVPKEKFKGPEGAWKDAATFVADGKRFNSILQRELESVRAELEAFKGTAKEFAALQQRQIEERDTQLADLQRQLKAQHREAIRNGDDDAADAIESRLEVVEDERRTNKKQIQEVKQVTPKAGETPPAVNEDGSTSNPVVTEWIEDGNSWFKENSQMRQYAFDYANSLIAAGEKKRGRPFLDLVSQKMQEDFPRHFARQRQSGAVNNPVEGGRSNSIGGRSVNDLPPEDRALMEVGIREGWTTQEKFLKGYFSDGPRKHS